MIAFIILSLIADPWGDASPFVEYGEGAGYGQAYYPENILGPPDPEATPESPAVGEDQLLTLGKNGIIVVEFTDNTVIDGEGPDFSVFENVLDTGAGFFQECAFVEVSQDGVNWIMFPYDGETLEGLAGVWPTTGQDPTNPEVSGGDQFDLETLGLEWIRFVRLTDCGDSVQDGGLFDLDAVASINWTTGIQEGYETAALLRVTSPFSTTFTVTAGESGTLRCYTTDGRLAGEWNVGEGPMSIQAEQIPSGNVFFKLNSSFCSAVKLVN